MGRTMPTECEHGTIIDWGDFGPDDDSLPTPCPECEAQPLSGACLIAADGDRASLTMPRGNPTLVGALLPTPAARHAKGPHMVEREGGLDLANALVDRARWGDYAPAIARHEATFGRPAPAPLEAGPKGALRLSAPFVEWMMGWPAGWVTELVSRSAALRITGNGVVARQAYAAYSALWERLFATRAA